jgi:hypothetical protein
MIISLFLVLVGLVYGATMKYLGDVAAHDNHDCFTLMTNVCGHALPFQIRMNLKMPKHMLLLLPLL